jgi:hypothetical protein
MSDFRIVLDSVYQQILEDIALQLGYTWGARGNVRALVEAIARGSIAVAGSTAFSAQQQQVLGRATIAALDRGEWQDALALGAVFKTLPIKDEGLRALVGAKLEPLQRAWVNNVFAAIEQHQSFKLSYQDAAGRVFTFNVCGAQFVAYEQRTYLDCWCLETEGNKDLPQLQHNWSLRLDRITDAETVPLKEKWRSLDSITIEMVLSGGLAYAYQPRQEDTLIEIIDEIKRVKRRITNTFWFVREVLAYGPDAQVIAPIELHDRIYQKFIDAAKQYE